MSAPQACVRLRLQRAVFWSPLMTEDQAIQLADDLERRIVECGDRWDFVRTDGYGGREIRVRGRDVFAVEVIPEGSLAEPRRLPSTAGGTGTVVNGGVVTGLVMRHGGGGQGEGGEAPGTAFLRQHALAHNGHPGGHR